MEKIGFQYVCPVLYKYFYGIKHQRNCTLGGGGWKGGCRKKHKYGKDRVSACVSYLDGIITVLQVVTDAYSQILTLMRTTDHDFIHITHQIDS